VGHPEQVWKGASGIVDGFLTALQLFPDRARPAPDEVRVVEGMVTDDVPGGDLGGQVRLAPGVVPDLEEGGPDTFPVQDLEELFGVWVARPVIEGQGDRAL